MVRRRLGWRFWYGNPFAATSLVTTFETLEGSALRATSTRPAFSQTSVSVSGGFAPDSGKRVSGGSAVQPRAQPFVGHNHREVWFAPRQDLMSTRRLDDFYAAAASTWSGNPP